MDNSNACDHLYVLNYFRKVFQIPEEVEIGYGSTSKKINIKIGEKVVYFKKKQPLSYANVIRKTWKGKQLPFLFDASDHSAIYEVVGGKAFIHFDILASSFFFLSGWQEYVYFSQEKALRFPFQNSAQNILGISNIPVVNYYFDILKTVIEKMYSLTLSVDVWGEHSFGICLTHDIDRTNSGWIQDGYRLLKSGRLLQLARLVFRRFAKKDAWFNFDRIVQLEQNYSARSTFFFLPRRGKVTFPAAELQVLKDLNLVPYNADYSLEHPTFQQLFQQLRDGEFEIAIHGSLKSHLSSNHLLEDLNRFPFPIIGNRFHYLFFDRLRSFEVLEKAGLKYDSTLGFAEAIGFRNGIAYPFPPYNFHTKKPYSVIEIPLLIMDGVLQKNNSSSQGNNLQKIQNILNETAKFQGCTTILWHNHYFSAIKYKGWAELYENLLREGQKRNALMTSGEDIYYRWRNIID